MRVLVPALSASIRLTNPWPFSMDGLHWGGGVDASRYDGGSNSAGFAGTTREEQAKTCSCTCCSAFEQADESWACQPPYAEDARCPSTCKLGCDTVLQSSSNGLVDMARFCLFDCKPYGHAKGAGCTVLAPEDIQARSRSSGNPAFQPPDPVVP
jgi:hypothetical protein